MSIFSSNTASILRSNKYLLSFSCLLLTVVYGGSSCGVDADSDGDGYYAIDSIRGTRYFDCDPGDPKTNIGVAYYKDFDKDGFGDINSVCFICDDSELGDPPCIPADATDEERSIEYVPVAGDCDDGVSEITGSIFLFEDLDGDSFGEGGNYSDGGICVSEVINPEDWTQMTKDKSAFVQNNGDCGDNETVKFYLDVDGDKYGRSDVVYYSCNPDEVKLINADTSSMLTVNGGDCNDGDITKSREDNLGPFQIYPGRGDCRAIDSGDIVYSDGDDDCDGQVNEDATFYFRDDELQGEVKKGDGYGDRFDYRFLCSSKLDMLALGYKPIGDLKGFDCDPERYDETNGGDILGTECNTRVPEKNVNLLK